MKRNVFGAIMAVAMFVASLPAHAEVTCDFREGRSTITSYKADVDVVRKKFRFDGYVIVGITDHGWENDVIVFAVEEERVTPWSTFDYRWVWAGTCQFEQISDRVWRCSHPERGKAKIKIVASQEGVGDLVRVSIRRKLRDDMIPEIEQAFSNRHRIRLENLTCELPTGYGPVLTSYREWEGTPDVRLRIGWTTDPQ